MTFQQANGPELDFLDCFINAKFLHIHRDRGHNSHGYSKSRLGCFDGSLYIFPFTRGMGKKWIIGILLIELRNKTLSIRL
ncbi:hypothetical protein POPTR_002G235550v4 [Populus trichocarpa]|uniref:Uncharacterized protein n=1 Tax=Populus trichocarpa TaxID=3694 RepID=A0ACC0TFS4_POPTR|nr:hypothetical protein POPTR_002G235550v4 [Populus trichocarpa]